MSVRSLLALAFAAGALALPSAAAAASCPDSDTTISSASIASAEAAVLCIVNAERAARDLPVVHADDDLALAARRHSQDMVDRDFFAHEAPDPAPFGVSPGDRIEAAGYDWWSYGENIAVGYRTPREVMKGWMKSPGHCHNILDPGFTELGVGITAAAATIRRGIGTWTQDFGRPAGKVAPSTNHAPQEACSTSTALLGLDNVSDVLPSVDIELPDLDHGPDTEDPAPAEPGSDHGSDAVAPGTTPAPSSALAVAARHLGRRLTIAGTLAAADRTRVRIAITRHGRTLWRGTARLRNGKFRLRLRVPRRLGRVTVVVRAGEQRVTRPVS